MPSSLLSVERSTEPLWVMANLSLTRFHHDAEGNTWIKKQRLGL